MEELRFIQLRKDDPELFAMAREVWLPFIQETDAHDGIEETDEEILNGLEKRIAIQGTRNDMHFELALLGDAVIGIAMFAIDLGTIYGILDAPGYGTVMGFYIKPNHRRKGFGRLFFQHIQAVLKDDGAPKLYVCPDSVTGIPFWLAMGFADSGKRDPDVEMPIYIKDIRI